MAVSMQRMVYTTYCSGSYVKDKQTYTFTDESFNNKLDLNGCVREARKRFDSRQLIVEPMSIRVETHTFKMPTDVFVACCNSYDAGTLSIGDDGKVVII